VRTLDARIQKCGLTSDTIVAAVWSGSVIWITGSL
jgi:hypothetical protein